MTTEERRNHLRQIGGLGGATTVQRYGTRWMREIARIGFAVTAERHYAGNRAACRAALIAQGRHFATTPALPGLIR